MFFIGGKQNALLEFLRNIRNIIVNNLFMRYTCYAAFDKANHGLWRALWTDF